MICECTVRVLRCDRVESKSGQVWWDIAFEIEATEYPTQYIPITVYSYELPAGREDVDLAIQLAASKALPQQIMALYTKRVYKEPNYFDTLAEALANEGTND
jgi:hypothetical protein